MRDLDLDNFSKIISIVVCAFNEEKYIQNCLDSIAKSIRLTGRGERFEVICVDNSSVDRTGEIAHDFCDGHSSFRYIRIRHCSLSISRNTALIATGGEYVAYVDADGFVHEQWASCLLAVLEKQKPDVVSGPVKEAELSRTNIIYELHYAPPQEYNSNYLIGANMIFRKKLLEKVDGFPSFFEVRGDESSLFVNLKREAPNFKHVFASDVTTYNHFCSDLGTFIKTHFYDGTRSYYISYFSKPRWLHFVNCSYRIGSVMLFAFFLLLAAFGFQYAIFSLLGLLGLKVARERKYYFRSLKKVLEKPSTVLVLTKILDFANHLFVSSYGRLPK